MKTCKFKLHLGLLKCLTAETKILKLCEISIPRKIIEFFRNPKFSNPYIFSTWRCKHRFFDLTDHICFNYLKSLTLSFKDGIWKSKFSAKAKIENMKKLFWSLTVFNNKYQTGVVIESWEKKFPDGSSFAWFAAVARG